MTHEDLDYLKRFAMLHQKSLWFVAAFTEQTSGAQREYGFSVTQRPTSPGGPVKLTPA